MKGIVAKSTGSWYTVLTEDGKELQARIKGKFRLKGMKATNPVAVGDSVILQNDLATGDYQITEIADRQNYIIRKSSNLSSQYHIIAANMEQAACVVTIAYPRTSQGFIDRFLITAEAYEITPLIIFNKEDLAIDKKREKLEQLRALYNSLGYGCLETSAKTGLHMDELRQELHGKTSLLIGHSGAGKSTILNFLCPELELRTGVLSDWSGKGKHTTTFAEMHFLNAETRIIDTPGIKEFGLVDFKKEEISHYFPEMKDVLSQCKFNNCLHINEPGCKILRLLELGQINPERYASYLNMLDDDGVEG
ncbi:MAG: ribosome small subunit-dependent GTPase A [Bacteroidia bacterium]